MSIIREDPPGYGNTGRRPDSRYFEIAEKLTADPGNWYKVTEGASWPELANRIKRGDIKAFQPRGSFQATARRAGGAFTIYARYVGDAS